MKKWIALVLTLVLSLSLIACGDIVDKQAAVDAFNKANELFNDMADAINENAADFGQDVIDGMNSLADSLEEHKDLLENAEDLTKEQLDDLILHKAKIWLDTGSIFGQCSALFQRVVLACPRSVVEEAMQRLKDAIGTLSIV